MYDQEIIREELRSALHNAADELTTEEIALLIHLELEKERIEALVEHLKNLNGE